MVNFEDCGFDFNTVSTDCHGVFGGKLLHCQ